LIASIQGATRTTWPEDGARQIGALEAGAFADIVFWDKDYRVCQTIVSGKSVYKI
jgi:N-acetylglucosamine-6-phosphate deacetylase